MPTQSFVFRFPVVSKKTGADTQTREVGPIILCVSGTELMRRFRNREKIR